MSTTAYVVIGIALLIAVWAVLVYNGLVRARNKVEEAWSGVDVQLKRRHDLVPNLVETVKGYAAHERETLAHVTQARARAMAADDPAETQRAETSLSAALGSIRALAEDYPELRAAENFRLLQGELAEVEDEIQAARRIYNSNTQDYNTRIQVIPNVLIAGPMSFAPRPFFEIEVAAERAVPQVAF